MRDRHGDPILVDLRPDSDSPVRRASFGAISCGMTYPPAMLRYRVGPNSSGAIPRLASTSYVPHITPSFGRAILSASRIVLSTCTIVNPLRVGLPVPTLVHRQCQRPARARAGWRDVLRRLRTR